MKKFGCFFLAILLVLSLTACGGKTSTDNPYYDAESGVIRLSELKSDMLKGLNITDALNLGSDAMLSQYGIQGEDIADLACFVTLDGAFPQEIVMVRASSADAANRVKERLQTRLEEFRIQSQNYDAVNYAIAQKCSILTSGNYVAMFLTPDYEAMRQMFQSAMEV